MSRHIDDIKNMLFDEPDFDSDNNNDEVKSRFDVHKLGIKGFEKSKYEDARVALAVSLGAKLTNRKFINYRELIEEKYKWTFDDEPEDEKPIIVELDNQ
ncbi:unnamed protein product [Rotaria sordida]|uniref:Uncharacterized protein n=1 Tax=Rotaria sordida TaxID=392033 RepID=A0A814I8B3_9BILA|nr:unnamed protein product [Rotaria sordida]CAF1130817.1 unnamed protein product [Rotaria sordida]